MTDISLRQYLNNLEPLLRSGASAEVIHHCRHILQYFPKNAETYRYLGRALATSSKWNEAAEVYQRVLSVYPDDYNAHSGLSEAYLRLKRPDDAIWHLERSFEQDPNNPTIIETLRELYRRQRRAEQGKVQLTNGAVARQYLRNGLYEQAVDTLQGALERTPDRVDLRLLLAQTYQEAGSIIEAGENALEVLETLPDCLEANSILAQLWLSAERPSDAQRYINRIQSVDPYAALELAQGGQPAPDDAFKLEELDYQRIAEREILTAAPDWLQDVPQDETTTTSGDDLPDWTSSFAPSQTATNDDDDVAFDDDFSSGLPDDWLTDLEDSPPPAPPASAPANYSGLLSGLNPPKSAAPEPAYDPELEFPLDNLPGTDELFSGQTERSNVIGDGLDLFAEEDPTAIPPAAQQTGTGDLRDSDPLAWLKDSGVEIIDNASRRSPGEFDLFGADDDNVALGTAESADPLAWLQGYGDDLVVNAGDSGPLLFPDDDDNIPLATEDAADPLAWLQGSGVEVIEEPPSAASAPVPQTNDPLDWLADESLLDEALDVEALLESTGPLATSEFRSVQTAPSPDITERQDTMFDDSDNDLDWLQGDEPEQPQGDDNLPDWLVDVPVNRETPKEPDVPDEEDAFAWMNEAEDPAPSPSMDIPDWLSDSAPAAPVASQSVADDLDWMSETSDAEVIDNDEDMPDWLSASAPPAAIAEPAASEMPDWMSAGDAFEPMAEQPTNEMPDWMTSSEETSAAATSTEWASAEAESAFEDDTPDWMLAAVPTAESEPEWASAEAEEEPTFEADVPDWMLAAAPAAAMATAEDDLDWMATDSADEVEPESDDFTLIEGIGPVTAEALRNSGITTFEQIATTSPEELLRRVKIEQGVTLVSDTTTWPRQAQYIIDGDMQGLYAYQDYLVAGTEPEAPPQESWSDAPVADDLSWMSAATSLEADDEQGLADTGVEAMPDWLSEAAPAQADEPQFAQDLGSSQSGFEWMSEDEPEDAEGLADTGVEAMPDWLSASATPTAEDEPEYAQSLAADDSGFEWMSEAQADDEEGLADTGVEAMPDWLSSAAPLADEEDEPAFEQQPVTDAAGFEWMSEAEPDDEGLADTGVEAMPDWLSSAAPLAEEDDEPAFEQQPVTDAAGFDWMSEAEPDDEGLADTSVEAMPDWLSSAAPLADEEDEPAFEQQPVTDAAGFEWMSEAEPDDEGLGDTGVEAMPDWLSSAAPLADEEDQPAFEQQPVTDAAGFEWMSEVEADNDEGLADTGVEAMPDWLSEAAPAPEPTNEFSFDAPSDSNFTWMDELQADEPEEPEVEAEMEEEPAATMPDWLASAAPATSQTVRLDDPDDGFNWGEEEAPAEETSSEMPEWLNNIQPREEEVGEADSGEPSEFSWINEMNEPVTEVDEAAFSLDEPEWAEAAVEAEDDFAEEPGAFEEEDFVPQMGANNAPDWLNAMVPGLDIDFDAPEDEQVEEAFVEPAPAEEILPVRNHREFDWLMNVVEEETQQLAAVTNGGKRRRFIFSRLPAWLRRPAEKPDQPAPNQATSGGDDDLDDIDLPPWLQ